MRSIPSELGLLTATTELLLMDNLLTGTLSSDFRAWTSLEYLWLQNNFLSGTLHQDFLAWTNLMEGDFRNNCFEFTPIVAAQALNNLVFYDQRPVDMCN